MKRLRERRFLPAIQEAWITLPVGIQRRLAHVDFLCGVDPVYAGLHGYEEMTFGRSYRDTMHCAYRFHASDGRTTIVMPAPEEPYLIVHELAHALDETLDFAHKAAPVTPYGATDRYEAFAEAFVAWRYHYGDQEALHRDGATLALFRGLMS